MGLHFEKSFLANESFFGVPQQNPQRKREKISVCIYKASSLSALQRLFSSVNHDENRKASNQMRELRFQFLTALYQ